MPRHTLSDLFHTLAAWHVPRDIVFDLTVDRMFSGQLGVTADDVAIAERFNLDDPRLLDDLHDRLDAMVRRARAARDGRGCDPASAGPPWSLAKISNWVGRLFSAKG